MALGNHLNQNPYPQQQNYDPVQFQQWMQQQQQDKMQQQQIQQQNQQEMFAQNQLTNTQNNEANAQTRDALITANERSFDQQRAAGIHGGIRQSPANDPNYRNQSSSLDYLRSPQERVQHIVDVQGANRAERMIQQDPQYAQAAADQMLGIQAPQQVNPYENTQAPQDPVYPQAGPAPVFNDAQSQIPIEQPQQAAPQQQLGFTDTPTVPVIQQPLPQQAPQQTGASSDIVNLATQDQAQDPTQGAIDQLSQQANDQAAQAAPTFAEQQANNQIGPSAELLQQVEQVKALGGDVGELLQPHLEVGNITYGDVLELTDPTTSFNRNNFVAPDETTAFDNPFSFPLPQELSDIVSQLPPARIDQIRQNAPTQGGILGQTSDAIFGNTLYPIIDEGVNLLFGDDGRNKLTDDYRDRANAHGIELELRKLGLIQ